MIGPKEEMISLGMSLAMKIIPRKTMKMTSSKMMMILVRGMMMMTMLMITMMKTMSSLLIRMICHSLPNL